jgi:hypothetical protein
VSKPGCEICAERMNDPMFLHGLLLAGAVGSVADALDGVPGPAGGRAEMIRRATLEAERFHDAGHPDVGGSR